MKRSCMPFLEDWLVAEDRKPLVIRGARQVGKTWLVRQLAKTNHKKLIEINLERFPKLEEAFESNEPSIILRRLSGVIDTSIDPLQCILFIDEIQQSPKLLVKLRWFAEEMPEMPVIAAGSLLEFRAWTP